MVYDNPQGVKTAFAELAGLTPDQIFFTNHPFELSPPPGVDWADYEEQEEGPPIRTPRPAWDWYREQYPQLATEPPAPEQVATWVPPPEPVEEVPLTDVERVFQRVQFKLNSDEEKRTGKPVNPDGAVPLARAMAATCLIYFGWHYPSEADLETDFNQFLLSKIYEDPTTNTNAQSSTAQKRGALHFTLVMLEGQAFGLTYQAQLGAYERTASGQFQADLAEDGRDWLDELECPKMHKDWPAFATVRAMFQGVMK